MYKRTLWKKKNLDTETTRNLKPMLINVNKKKKQKKKIGRAVTEEEEEDI